MVLNGQAPEWQKVLAGVPQSSLLGLLLFFIFINDIPTNPECNVKIFADDTYLFSLVSDPNESSPNLGRDLGKVVWRAYQWKMSFSPYRSTQAVEVHFPRRINHLDILPVYINNLPVASSETHKHLGLLLDKRMAFDRHVEVRILRANKDIGLINGLRRYLQRNSLLTIYKAFIRPHIDYGRISCT